MSTVKSFIPPDHVLDGGYCVEPYTDGSGWYLNKPVNGRSGFIIANAATSEELILWARRRGAKRVEVIT